MEGIKIEAGGGGWGGGGGGLLGSNFSWWK